MRAVYGLHDEPAVVQRAVEALRAVEVPDRNIVVISSEPSEEWEFSQRDRATWLYWIAAAGGALGLLLGSLLTSATEAAWPLMTGNMPILSWWPNLVVMFEMTMLGAILATVIGLVVTTRLGRRPALYDPAISDGQILVGVVDGDPGARDVLVRVLTESGITAVKTVDAAP